MSIFGNISMLSQAMQTFQEGMNVVSNNTANAATAGYSLEALQISSSPTVLMNGLQIGTGDYATTIESLRNNFLDNQIYLQLSNLGEAQARQTALNDLSALFPEVASPTATTGIQGALTNLEAQWTALASAPTSAAAQTSVRNALTTVAVDLNQDSQEVYNTQQNLDGQVVNDVTQINSYLNQIATLNQQILQVQSDGPGNNPNTLIDARELAAQNLSQLIGVNIRTASDGSMSVTMSAGTLVSEGQAYNLVTIPSQTIPGMTDVGYRVNTGDTYTDITQQISGGEIAGTIQARDVDAQNVLLALNQIAYGLIQNSNQINQTAVASDGTSNHVLFTGTNAMDIALNPILNTNVSYIGATSDPNAPGETAKIQAAQNTLLAYSNIESSPIQGVPHDVNNPAIVAAINPAIPISSLPGGAFTISTGAPTPANPGEFVISSGGNAVDITWTVNDSINEIINEINTNGGGGIYATFNQTTNKMFIYSDAPVSVYDVSASFAQAMQLSAVVTSSAPINNSPISSYNPVYGAPVPGVPNADLNAEPNLLDLYTKADPIPQAPLTYGLKVNNSTITWSPTQNLATIFGNIQGANVLGSGQVIYPVFNAATQIVSLVHDGNTNFNTGTLSAANPMTSITVGDVAGNLSQVLNFDTNANPTSVFSQMITTLSTNVNSESTEVTQAQAMVTQTQNLQTEVSGAGTQAALEAEQAQATLYQDSFDASVQLQQVMAQMMDVLINHTGSEVNSSDTGPI